MSIGMAKARAISMYIGGIALIACGILMIMNENLNGILWLELLIGLGLFGGGLFEFLGLQKPLKDERVARIGTRAATYSWYSVLIAVGFIGMVYGMGGGYKIGMQQAVGSLLIVMVISIFAFNWYLGRKGDVD